MSVRIVIGADHGGYELKDVVRDYLEQQKYEVMDVGTFSPDSVDYPDYAVKVGQAILDGKADIGIMICGSGVGACVAINKIPGIRAGLCHDTFSAHQGREDDDINVLCLGARVIGHQLALEIVRTFLNAKFSGLERHVRRLGKVHALELKYAGQPK
jgi:RpiB/LacA/LacB family sugar-phosphate isomerase